MTRRSLRAAPAAADAAPGVDDAGPALPAPPGRTAVAATDLLARTLGRFADNHADAQLLMNLQQVLDAGTTPGFADAMEAAAA